MSSILAVLGLVQANIGDLSGIMDKQTYGVIVFVLAIAVGLLRFATDKGLHEK